MTNTDAAVFRVAVGRPQATVKVHFCQAHVDLIDTLNQLQCSAGTDVHARQVVTHDTGRLAWDNVGQTSGDLWWVVTVDLYALGWASFDALPAPAAGIGKREFIQRPRWAQKRRGRGR